MRSVAELDDRLTTPSEALVADMKAIDGDILVLGAGGKLGPSLVRLAMRAVEAAGTGQQVLAVSRFTGSPGAADELRAAGAAVISADVSTADALAILPDAPNVIFLVGAKFGTSGREHATWYTNSFVPGLVAQRFRESRIVALSTGNVYPLSLVTDGGSTEETPPAPVGEYGMSCLGRERILAHAAHVHGTRLALIRLNYAVEMRYGVLLDVGRAVANGDPVDLATGHVNVVWQGYANQVILRSLLHAQAPPFVLNLTGPEILRVRHIGQLFADRLGVAAHFSGVESETALLSDAGLCHQLFGYPDLTARQLVDFTADWIAGDRPTLDKPTAFQRRDGQF